MIETTKYVVEEHKCLIGHTSSDEMSFIILNKYGAPCDFDGEKQKLVSSMASSATAYFNAHLHEYLPEKVGTRLPRFDCRIWTVPDEAYQFDVLADHPENIYNLDPSSGIVTGKDGDKFST